MFLEASTKGLGSFPCAFVITGKVTTLEPIYGPLLLAMGSLSLERPVGFDGAITFEVGLYTIPLIDPFNAFTETLGVQYDYVALGFNFIGSGLGACGTLAVSPIIDLTGRRSKPFIHLV